jgi:hypothetical protein
MIAPTATRNVQLATRTSNPLVSLPSEATSSNFSSVDGKACREPMSNGPEVDSARARTQVRNRATPPAA